MILRSFTHLAVLGLLAICSGPALGAEHVVCQIDQPDRSYTILRSIFPLTMAVTAHAAPAAVPSMTGRNMQASLGVKWVNPQLPKGPGLQHYVLHSTALGCEVGYVVWRPPHYTMTNKYPVVYFLHGSNGTESSDAVVFSGWVAQAIEKGLLPPVLVVFPNGGLSGYRGAVETMVVEELIPLIDRTYPTLAQAESRAVVGFSMGGQGAVRLSVLHPGLFAAAASLGGRAGGEVNAAAEKNAPALRRRKVSFLLINGEKDQPKAFQVLVKTFIAAGVEHSLLIHPNLKHNLGRYCELSFEQLMQFLGAHLSDKPEEISPEPSECRKSRRHPAGDFPDKPACAGLLAIAGWER